MRILVTGVNGQLGYDVCKMLSTRSIENQGVDIQDFDITDAAATAAYIRTYAPTAVIHCAAYTAVDKAEEEEDKCMKINAVGTGNIARVCDEVGAKILYISTDYVFAGDGEAYFETTDVTGPLSIYGKSKLAGEKAIQAATNRYFIVRTSWVFGLNGGNFIKTMLRLSETRDEVGVVCDQVGSPTYTPDLARLICDMIVTEKFGIYHATNEGLCSWAELAEEVFRLAGKMTRVKYLTSGEYHVRAMRPLNSRLSKRSLDEAGFVRLPSWQDSVYRYIKELSL